MKHPRAMPIDWRARVRAALSTVHVPDDDVVEELAQHLRAMYEAARAEGASNEEAVEAALDHLHAWQLQADALRRRQPRQPLPEEPSPKRPFLSGLALDVCYAIRRLRRDRHHTWLSLATVGLSIGAATVLFSLTYGVLAKALPWSSAERIVVLRETRGGNAPRFGEFSSAAYLGWRESSTTIEDIAAWSSKVVTLADAGEPERIRITAATASLFTVLRAGPMLGSAFDQHAESTPVIVLSERLWRRRFAGNAAVLGRHIRLDGEPYTIMGVLPDRLAYPDRQSLAIVPMSVKPSSGDSLAMFSAIARLRSDVSPAQAAAEATARARLVSGGSLTAMAIFGSNGQPDVTARPLREALTEDVRRPLIILLTGVVLLLLAATGNVASLQFARGLGRRREIAIRVALGADTTRAIRQLTIEGVMLGMTGGVLGLGFAWFAHRSLVAVLPREFPRSDDLDVDAIVAGFALAVSIVAAVVFAWLPARRARRMDLVGGLVEGGATSVGVHGRSPSARPRMAIMTGQVAIASMLLIGAGLLGHSFLSLLHNSRGYDPTNVMSVLVSMPTAVYPAARRAAIVDQILSRLASPPGVHEAAFTSELPLSAGGSTSAFTLTSPFVPGGRIEAQASPRIVSPRYFAALRMRIVAGRTFTDQDTETSQPVVVVNDSFARRYLGGDAIGRTLPMIGYGTAGEDPLDSTIVGVVGDVRYVSSKDVVQPEVYYSYRQIHGGLPVQTVTFLVRWSGDEGSAALELRTAVRQSERNLAADAVMPLGNRLLAAVARPRLYALLVAGFAAAALIIAAAGLVGVVSYFVSERSREIGIRTALGARRSDIARLVLRQGLGVTLAGLAVGLSASAALAGVLSSQLYGITARDPLTFVAVPVVIVAVALGACWLPARRAARLDPLMVLRRG